MKKNIQWRWSIFLADLEPVKGSEQGKTRPVLVISDEDLNEILPVVNVLPITSCKKERKIFPNETFINAGIGNLENDSVVLCYQIRTLDKSRLIKHIGSIQDLDLQNDILEALAFQLGI